MVDVQTYKLPDGPVLVIASKPGAYIGFNHIDLTGINQVTGVIMAPKDQLGAIGGTVEVHLDAPDGELLGQSAEISPTTGQAQSTPPQQVKIALKQKTGFHDLYFVFKNEQIPDGANLFVITQVMYESNK